MSELILVGIICLVLVLVVCAAAVYISACNNKGDDERFKVVSIFCLCWITIIASMLLCGIVDSKESSKRTTDEEHCCQTECCEVDSTMVNKYE